MKGSMISQQLVVTYHNFILVALVNTAGRRNLDGASPGCTGHGDTGLEGGGGESSALHGFRKRWQ